MIRNLYRCYLYSVFVALLTFAVVAMQTLLNTILAFTPLRGSSGVLPAQAQVVQSIVFALVACVVAGILGGLHYWLIRRDIQNDSAASASAIRSFFLNLTVAISLSLGVAIAGFSVINNLGQFPSVSVVGAASAALPTLVLAILLELERRRTSPGTAGTALAFQRLHFYGVQVVLLIFLSFAWFNMMRPLVDGLFFGGQGTLESCRVYQYSGCPTFNQIGLTASTLWFIGFWLVYGRTTKEDTSRLLRLILHCASLAYGIGLLLFGIYLALELAILPLFGSHVRLMDVLGLSAQYDFVSPFTLGILVVVVYHFWLNGAVMQKLVDRTPLFLTECAIGATLSAALFWWGCAYMLVNIFQTISPVPNAPEVHAWVSAIALLIIGLSYIPLDVYLYRRNRQEPALAAGPRRGFVLALLGGGILALAIGGAVALYAWITALLGSPIVDWQQVARTSLGAFIVGCLLVGIYLLVVRRERLLTAGPGRRVVSSLPPVPSPQPADIEGILDDLLANKITRGEAAARIRTLITPSVEAHVASKV